MVYKNESWKSCLWGTFYLDCHYHEGCRGRVNGNTIFWIFYFVKCYGASLQCWETSKYLNYEVIIVEGQIIDKYCSC